MPEATGTGWIPGLRKVAAGDLEAVARLEGGFFGVEAWGRDLLATELVVFYGPMIGCRYVAVESEESDGDGDAYDVADRAVGTGSHGSWSLGYTGLHHAGRLTGVDLLTIATIPAARGRGATSFVLAEFIPTVREASCSDALLEVCQSNEAAQWFYIRHGLVPIDRRRCYYQASPEDTVVMWLTLHPRPGPVGAEAGDPSGV